jgi:hypothetical protein
MAEPFFHSKIFKILGTKKMEEWDVFLLLKGSNS